jgi:DNA ligase (NAD+)
MNFKPLIKNPKAFVKTLTVKEMVEMATELDRLYHELDDSPVPDEAFDILVKEIAERSPNNKYLKKVGSKALGGIKVRLNTPMPSLDKRFPGTKELTKFLSAGDQHVLSDKKDGQSLTLGYQKGRLTYAYTRGDGIVGQDVSGICPALGVPQSIGKTMEVRVEFIMSKAKFDSKYKGKVVAGRKYKVARNMAAGLSKRNEPSKFVRDVDVRAFEILSGYGSDQPQSKQLAILKQLGFNVVPYKVVKNLTEQKLVAYYNERRAKSEYEIDGIVVARDVSYKHTAENPKHAVAFKINSLENSVVTKVLRIEWKQSRHNKLVPTVWIEPVTVNGVEINKITGHNWFFIQNGFRYKDRASKPPVRAINVGAEVRILRRGDVIPHIEEVVRPARRPAVPSQAYKIVGVDAMAVETDASKERKILHFFTTMEVEGIKLGTIRKLEAVGLDSITRILRAGTADFVKAEGIQQATAIRLYKGIQAIKKNGATFAKLGHASGVFGSKIGDVKLQAVYDMYPRILSWGEKDTDWITAKLEQVEGISTLASVIAKRLPRFIRFLERNELKVVAPKRTKVKGSAMAGKSVLFTSVRDAELKKWIEENGGKIASTVKQANILIVKDKDAENQKITFARENGIPIHTVAGFKQKYGI